MNIEFIQNIVEMSVKFIENNPEYTFTILVGIYLGKRISISKIIKKK